jgi:hypothetical protein
MLYTIRFNGRMLCSLFATDENAAVDAFAHEKHCTAEERAALSARPVSGW